MIELNQTPQHRNIFPIIGTYNNHPIYTSERFPVENVAHLADDNKAICINSKVYHILKKSPKFIEYLTTICDHEHNNPPFHDKHETWSNQEEEVLRYLTESGIFE